MPFTYTPANATSQGTPAGVTQALGAVWDGLQLVIGSAGGRFSSAKLIRVPRNANFTYNPGGRSLDGDFASQIKSPRGLAWDGSQLVIGSAFIQSTNTTGRLYTLARNSNNSYTPSSASNQGNLPSDLIRVGGATWDGQQLVIVTSDKKIFTMAKAPDGTYTPADAVEQGTLPAGITSPAGLTWDGEQLVISDDGSDSLWTLQRNSNGGYAPATAVGQGSLPSALSGPTALTWDGRQLVILDALRGQIFTLPPDPIAPTVDAIAASPAIVNHNATTNLTATASDPNPGDTLSYRWTSNAGGTFGNATARNTTWRAPTSPTTSYSAILTLTVTDSTSRTATATVTVTVRAKAAPPLALPAIANQSGSTGDVVSFQLPSATNGRAPYLYTVTGLPPELGNIGRQIQGRLITSGSYSPRVTVTDSNGDTASRTFTWRVTGADIEPPAGVNIRIDWGQASYSNPNADVTARLRSEIRCSRGKATNTAVLGLTQAGKMTFSLENNDGLYDGSNTSSALSGLIRPGIGVQLRSGSHVLWTGLLDDFPTRYHPATGEHRVEVTALGVWSALSEAPAQHGSVTSTNTGAAFTELVESIGICAMLPDSGYQVIPRWWEAGSLVAAVRNIEATEGGFAFEDRKGNIGLQAAGHRAGQSSKMTFTTKAASGAERSIIGDPKRDVAVKDVITEVVGLVREYGPQTAQVIFERDEPIPIGLGQTLEIVVDYDVDGAIQSVDPVTDFTANTNAAGTGSNRKSALRITAARGAFNELRVGVSYPTGGSSTNAQVFLTSIKVTGTALVRLQPTKVVSRNAQAIARYRLKSLTLKDTWIHDSATMGTRTAALLASLDHPETRQVLRWLVDDWGDYAGLELSDLVTIKWPTFTETAFIERDELVIPLTGQNPYCILHTTVA